MDQSLKFISNAPFYSEFYHYRLTGPSGNKGYLTLVPSATKDACPANRILQSTGKKLIPNVNPMGFLLGKENPNPTTLIAVYDTVTFLRGYIDPSSPTFRMNIIPSEPLAEPWPLRLSYNLHVMLALPYSSHSASSTNPLPIGA